MSLSLSVIDLLIKCSLLVYYTGLRNLLNSCSGEECITMHATPQTLGPTSVSDFRVWQKWAAGWQSAKPALSHFALHWRERGSHRLWWLFKEVQTWGANPCQPRALDIWTQPSHLSLSNLHWFTAGVASFNLAAFWPHTLRAKEAATDWNLNKALWQLHAGWPCRRGGWTAWTGHTQSIV